MNLNRLRNLSPRGVTIIRSLMTLALPIVAVLAMVGMSQVPMASSTSPAARTMMVVVWVGFLWFLGVSLSIMVNRAAEALHSLPHPRPQPARRFQPRLWPPQLTHQRKLQPKHRSLTLLRHHTAQLHRAGLLNAYPRAGWVQARLRRSSSSVKHLPLRQKSRFVLSHLRAYRLQSVQVRTAHISSVLPPHQMNKVTGYWA